jgi:hypothetical protein
VPARSPHRVEVVVVVVHVSSEKEGFNRGAALGVEDVLKTGA